MFFVNPPLLQDRFYWPGSIKSLVVRKKEKYISRFFFACFCVHNNNKKKAFSYDMLDIHFDWKLKKLAWIILYVLL